MQSLVPEKLGEVLAFARVGRETSQKAQAAFMKIIGASALRELEARLAELESKILEYIRAHDIAGKADASAAESVRKMTSMRDTYIDDRWDEADEILEWSGFYTGGALVHWQLLYGAAESGDDKQLRSLGSEGVSIYSSLFSMDEKLLREYGAEMK